MFFSTSPIWVFHHKKRETKWIFMTITRDVCNKCRLLNPSTIPFLPFGPALMLKQSLMHVCPNTSLQIKAWLGYVKLKGLIEWPHPIQNVLRCICSWQGLMGYITQRNWGFLQHRHTYSNVAPVPETFLVLLEHKEWLDLSIWQDPSADVPLILFLQ